MEDNVNSKSDTTFQENGHTDEVLDKQHQLHCDKCISPARCVKYRSLHKNDPKIGTINCLIISCPLKCGWQFHECKKTEHELLCSRAKVACINKEYGCPWIMERSHRSKHLLSCPASVVVCTMEWNRWPLPPGKCQPFAFDPDHLDVSATLQDQQTIKLWKENIPTSLKNTLKTYMNEKHPVMPLGVAGHRIPKCILDSKHLADLDEISESPDTTEHDESSDSPWGSRRAPPGLQESVCHKLKALTLDNSNNNKKTVQIVSEIPKLQVTVDEDGSEGDKDLDEGSISSSADLLSCDNNDGWECDLSEVLQGYETPEVLKEKHSCRKEPLLNLTVEIISKYQIKPNSMYSFICAREFRRDELAGHFQHFHTEIHTQLNGWLFQRCPMANQGCSFGIHRMFPLDCNHRIVFNKALSTFSYSSKNHSVYSTTDNPQSPSLMSLPFEVLVYFTRFLDPLSLNSLAQVNSFLEDVCRDRLMHRGIVVPHWEKSTEKPGWIIKDYKWMYTVSFASIKNWVFGDGGRMANHMKHCPCIDRQVMQQ
ncbi:F-box only protein 30 [Orchesella cincta]|uniref:F-box only protein 30 n=1 Tax=Orchesella cincta TaxID=48709 RepID=A0A1D2MY75_ORCCI|nr:F-box only protein 30 [Orchesella cincta]